MAIIPLFRVIIFTLVTLFSLVVLGICAHIEYLVAGYTDFYLSFAPFGLGVACLTILSLPLFLVLGHLRHGVFTSMILFEIIWFFVLWMLWIGTAGDTVAGKAYHFPAGCIYDTYPTTNQVCNEFTVVEAFAFLNFFCAFIYYDVIFLYAIISAIRGKGIWTISVKEAATSTPGVPVVPPQFNAAPAIQYPNYGAYPSGVQPYDAYPQQVPPQGPASHQYNPYPQQAPPYGTHIIPPASQIQLHNLPPTPNVPQQQVNYVAYSPSPLTCDAPLPPQPNYDSYPAHSSQAQLPLPSGYQGQPIPPPQQWESQPLYGSRQPTAV